MLITTNPVESDFLAPRQNSFQLLCDSRLTTANTLRLPSQSPRWRSSPPVARSRRPRAPSRSASVPESVTGYASGNCRLAKRSTSSSSRWFSRLTVEAKIHARNSSVIAFTLRVDTPCTTSPRALTNAFSLRWYRSKISVHADGPGAFRFPYPRHQRPVVVPGTVALTACLALPSRRPAPHPFPLPGFAGLPSHHRPEEVLWPANFCIGCFAVSCFRVIGPFLSFRR